MKHFMRNSGQTIIELLLALGVSLIFIPALFGMFFVSREGRPQQEKRTQAVALATEAEEAVRSVREIDWDQFLTYQMGTAYHPFVANGVWTLVAGTETINGFTRLLTINPVYRKADGSIGTSGDTLDQSTRSVTVAVSWTTPLPTTVTTTFYLTRHSNILVTDTTVADFTAGQKQNVAITDLVDGEVVLGSTGGYGDWCTPNLTIAAVDLPGQGVANAISAIQGQIAAATGNNASGVSYANVLLSDPPYPTPPVASISGTYNGFKTNDAFIEQNYAYIATDTHQKEVDIINLQSLSNGVYNEAGYFADGVGSGTGNSVATSGNVGYMTDGNVFWTFDLSSKTGSRPALNSGLSLGGTGNKIVVVGSRAFVATEATNAQLTIIDVSAPNSPSIKDTIALPAQGAASVYVNPTGTRAYIVTHYLNTTQQNFFIVNVDPTSPGYKTILGTFNTGGMDPLGVTVVSGPRAILVGNGGQEYQVLDITTETKVPLPKCGGMTIASGVHGVSSVFTVAKRAYSYIITGDATSELKIIEGGPGASGKDYILNGTFTSRIFDVSAISTGSAEAAFNSIRADIINPSSVTAIKLQVAGAAAVGGSCTNANYVFVGPDGTGNSYYTSADNATINGAIPFASGGTGYVNPARCFRYQAYLSTTDPSLTPQLDDVTISLSP